MIDQPIAALCLASQEIERLAELGGSMLSAVKESIILDGSEKTDTGMANVRDSIHTVAELGNKIADYLTRMLGGGALTEKQAEHTAGLLFVTNSIQRVADRCDDIQTLDENVNPEIKTFSPDAKEDLSECVGIVQKLFDKSVEAVRQGDASEARGVFEAKDKLKKKQRRCKKAHLSRVKKGQCSTDLTDYYTSILSNLDRMADCCSEIAEEAVDDIAFVRLEEAADNIKSVAAV